MKVLIVGSGGREHALAWQAANSASVEKVFTAPGNAGTAGEPGVENVAIPVSDLDGLLAFALEQRISLTIVGPEDPLVNGIVDQFSEAGLACFGAQCRSRATGRFQIFCQGLHVPPRYSYSCLRQVH